GAVDLYRLRVASGDVAQLTSAPGWEWRAVPGTRPGEALAVLTDPAESKNAGLGLVDVATGALTRIASVETPSAAVAGDAIVRAGAPGGEVRPIRGGVDDVALVPPADSVVQQLVAWGDGPRLALLSLVQAQHRLCIGDLAARSVRCLTTPPLLPGRPA